MGNDIPDRYSFIVDGDSVKEKLKESSERGFLRFIMNHGKTSVTNFVSYLKKSMGPDEIRELFSAMDTAEGYTQLMSLYGKYKLEKKDRYTKPKFNPRTDYIISDDQSLSWRNNGQNIRNEYNGLTPQENAVLITRQRREEEILEQRRRMLGRNVLL
jgi:hypothetical protein